MVYAGLKMILSGAMFLLHFFRRAWSKENPGFLFRGEGDTAYVIMHEYWIFQIMFCKQTFQLSAERFGEWQLPPSGSTLRLGET